MKKDISIKKGQLQNIQKRSPLFAK